MDDHYDLRNPSPPPEKYDSCPNDTVGETTYSKHWILSLLKKLVENAYSNDFSCESYKLEKNFEEQLCCLWDVSADKDVSHLIMDINGPSLLLHVVEKSKSFRLNEIVIGIVANLSTEERNAEIIASDEFYRSFIMKLLCDEDTLTLIQVLRLMENLIQFDNSRKIIEKDILKSEDMLASLTFILESNTNNELLILVSKFLMNVMSYNDEIHAKWVKNNNLIKSVLEAGKELRKNDNTINCKYIHYIIYYIHCLEEANSFLDMWREDVIFCSKLFLIEMCNMNEIPDDAYDYINVTLKVLIDLFSSKTNTSFIYRSGDNNLILVLFKILIQFIQVFPKDDISNDNLLNSTIDIVHKILLLSKDSECEEISLFTDFNKIFDEENFISVKPVLKKILMEESIKIIFHKLLEKFPKEKFLSLRRDLNLIDENKCRC